MDIYNRTEYTNSGFPGIRLIIHEHVQVSVSGVYFNGFIVIAIIWVCVRAEGRAWTLH